MTQENNTKKRGRGTKIEHESVYLPYTQQELSEVKILAPLSKRQETYLNDLTNDIIVWGGAASSGKSYISALNILVNGFEDQHYRCGIVRRQKEQLKGAGSLYDECCQMYSAVGVKPKGVQMQFDFPSGAIARMAASDRPQDKHNFQGWQVTDFLCDEAQQLLEDNVVYLISRLRSKSSKKHQLRLTCNPDYSSFLRVWLEKGNYLLEDGTPNPEMDGKTTYFAEVAGETVILSSIEEFEKRYGKQFTKELEPLKFVFYSATVMDNPYIRKYQPSYVSKLKNLPAIERKRLYEGNWYAKEESSGYFKREWVTMVQSCDVPMTLRFVRAWDRAGTLPSTAYPDPDWTVGVKAAMDEQGNLWIADIIRFRDRPAIVQRKISEAGHEDGRETLIGIPKDPGAAGKEASEASRALLMAEGLNVVVNQASKSKAARFEPVAIAAQNRQIFVVKADWNEALFSELEQLDFNKRKTGLHDDIADALSDAYTMLRNKMIVPQIKVSGTRRIRSKTML